jgi:hypothetical protein
MAKISVPSKIALSPYGGAFNLQKISTTPITPAFSPADISGLLVWLKPSSLSGLTDGNTIASWADSSGNGYDSAQATETNKPTKQTVSGFSVARFDGADNFMTNTTLPAMTTGAFTLYVVAKRIETAAVYDTFFQFGDNTNTNLLLSYDNHANKRYTVNALGSAPPTTGPNSTTNIEFVKVRRSTNVFVSVNGGAETDFGDITLNPDAGYIIGGETAFSQYANLDIIELILYNTSLSAGNQTDVETYLDTTYGL